MHEARTPSRRLESAQLLGARRQLVADIVEGISMATTSGGPFDAKQLASMLLAMEDGFRLHRLIDPDATPPDSFVRSLDILWSALRPALE